ncbi:magnesium/cobalt transporter CorA [Chelativorans sp. J32]|uniref:magnesium/cobalt transporter CorA n=1 Tax=Chelativorans sp. J32 TaxID=935840 RepID=UPI000482D04A|nr:magnesium/cobalt transporter CorA [Chelativorans sp. J32]
MLRIYTSQNGHLTPVENFQRPEALGALWFDLLDPTHEEASLVESHLGIALPTRDEMAEIELSDRLFQEDGAEFMTVTTVTSMESDDPVKAPVTFVIKGQALVTVRHADPKPFRTYLAKAERGNLAPCTSGEGVMLGLIEAIIDRAADALERIGDEVDAISREVFRNKAKSVSKKTRNLQSLIEQIGRKGDLLTKLRESLVSVTRMIAFHGAVDRSARRASKDVRQRAKLIQRDAAALGEHAVFLSGKVNFLLDATLGLINLEQNQIIKIFSVAAVVFLPPTLVASIYGMNFDFMPELHWSFGYPYAIALMVVSAMLPYLYFKRRGWL